MSESTFARARRPEHKEQRREAIIAAARGLAVQTGVREVSLGDIATRVGLAKSNVVRYFGSREEIFLTLAAREWRGWADEVIGRLRGGDGIVDALAEPFATRPLLCDLLSQLCTTLMYNVSAQAAGDFRSGIVDLTRELAAAVAQTPTGLTEGEAYELAATAPLCAGTYYPASRPPLAMAELYHQEQPEPAEHGRLFVRSLKRTLAALTAGLPAQRPPEAEKR